MIKAAIEKILDLGKTEVKEINGQTYSDKSLYRINHNPKAERIYMNTLSSLIDYIKADVDKMQGKMIIHVVSPTEVRMYSELDVDRERECVVEVNAQLPDFRFNRYTDHEEFCINLQSKFIDNEDRKLLLRFAGTVEAGSVAEYGDDGVSQKATVKKGITSKEDALVPNPVSLIAYRTFLEVDQPNTEFIFRMKQDKYDGIQCGLFEADGGAWKHQAMTNIKMYLEEELEDVEGFIVIS